MTTRKATVWVGPTLVMAVPDLEACAPGLLGELQRRLTYPNPDYTPGSFEPEELHAYEVTAGSSGKAYLRVPRGAINLVRKVFEIHQAEATFDTRAVVSRSSAHLDPITVDPALRDYQRQAARLLLSRVQGVIEIPTGGGKTRTLSAAMVASREPGITFVHTEDLLDQWVEAYTRLGRTPRIVQGGDAPCGPLLSGDAAEIAIAMIPTVAENLTRFAPMLQSAGAVIFDEGHHLPAQSWRSISSVVPARFRWAGTATKDRDDGTGFLLDFLVGPTVFSISTKELIRRGFLQSPTVIPADTGWKPSLVHYFAFQNCPVCKSRQKRTFRELLSPEGAPCKHAARKKNPCGGILRAAGAEKDRLNYSDAQTDAAADPKVQALVTELVELGVNAGRTFLHLNPRRESVDEINERIRSRGIASVGVTSSSGKRARKEAIEGVRSGKYAGLVATTLADEGLDIPNLDFGVNLMSGKSRTGTKQRTGRLLRLQGEKPVLVELVHQGEEYERQWERRMSTYVREYGARSVVRMIPGTIDDVRTIISPPEADKTAVGF